MRDVDDPKPRRAWFGRIDLFCWLFVVPLFLLGIATIGTVDRPVGIALLVVAVVIALFDSWSNRPDLRTQARSRARR